MPKMIKLSKVLKLNKVLNHGDSLEIGNGFFVEVYFRDIENGDEDDIYDPNDKDKNRFEGEYPTTYLIKHDYGIDIDTFKGSPYIHGGIENAEDIEDDFRRETVERIYRKNLNRQRKDINEILIDLHFLIECSIAMKDEQNGCLGYSLTYAGEEVPEQMKTNQVLKHGDIFPIPCDVGMGGGAFQNFIEIMFGKYGDYVSREYNPEIDEKERKKFPTSFIIRDDDGNLISVYNGKYYISGGNDDEENLKRQNQALKGIYANINKTIRSKIAENKDNIDILHELICRIEVNEFSPSL